MTKSPDKSMTPTSSATSPPATQPCDHQQFFQSIDRAEDLIAEALQDGRIERPSLSVVIPVYNERETLPRVIQAVQELEIDKEIVVVDDASSDGTTEWLAQHADLIGVRAVLRRRNHGKGSALRLGFRHCRGQIITIQDADLEYDPSDLLHVIRPIQEGICDVAYGSRYLDPDQQDPSLVHRLGNRALTSLSNLTTGLRLTDMETCYKAFRREIIRSMPLKQCRFGFEPEVTAKVARRRYRLLEVPIQYNSRSYDEGKKIGWRDGVNAIYCMMRYWRYD